MCKSYINLCTCLLGIVVPGEFVRRCQLFQTRLWIFCVLDLFTVFVACSFSHFTRMRLYLVPLMVLGFLVSEDFSAVFCELGCSECFCEDVCGVFGGCYFVELEVSVD